MSARNGHGAGAGNGAGAGGAGRKPGRPGRKRKRGGGAAAGKARVWTQEEMIPEGSADCPYILWAKMGSHPWWPARGCTDDEKERLRDVKPVSAAQHSRSIFFLCPPSLAALFRMGAGCCCDGACVGGARGGRMFIPAVPY